MSENYPPYGEPQPGPNTTPWSAPPGPPQQGGYPPYGQPPPTPHYGAPLPPAPNKSNQGLIIGLVAGAVVLILAICGAGVGLLLAYDDDDSEPTVVASSAPTLDTGSGTGSAPDPAAPPTPGAADQPNNNNSMTARYSSDLSNVCEGSPILNTAPYNGPTSAKAYTFSNNPDRPTSWSSKYIPSDKPYYAKSEDYQKVSVVGCLKFDEGSEGSPKKCQYKDKSEKQITIDYVSSRYTLTFYAAKTAEKIGGGGTVTAPTTRCPSFISYDKATMRAYAAPDSGTIEAALDKFLS